MQVDEQRQRARISWRFWVAVEGVDDFPRLRNGNISLTGVYFETSQPLGSPGSVQWLYLGATEQGPPVEVMARVIRVVTLDDVHRGSIPVGVALEFMPETQDARGALRSLVKEIGTGQLEGQQAHAATGDLRPTRRPLSVQDLQLETDWQLSIGAAVYLELRCGHTGRRGTFEGTVVENVPLPGQRARVRVQVVHEGQRFETPAPTGREVGDLLFFDLEQGRARQGEQLVGSLARIRLPSLLSFFELERISGELRLRGEQGQQASMYFDGGQLVDVEPSEPNPRDAVARLVAWNDGTFEFLMGDVDRPDRLGITTTALLLEIALAQDGR